MYPKRRSIRLPGYDYTQPGEYFITINTHGFKSIFGAVDGERVRLSPIGQIARQCWIEIPNHFENTEIGPFIVMPNHFHGIVHIIEKDNCTGTAFQGTGTAELGTGTACRARTLNIEISPKAEQFGKPVKGSLPTIVRAYKSAVTKRINEYRGTPGAIVWHRNYYEHIICSDEEYATIAAYIEGNPTNWEGRK